MSCKLTSHINIYRIYTCSVHFDNDFIWVVYDRHHHVLSKSKHFVLPIFIYHPSGHDRAPRRGSTNLSNGKLSYTVASPEANRSTCLSSKDTSLQKFHREPVVEVRALIKMHWDWINLSPPELGQTHCPISKRRIQKMEVSLMEQMKEEEYGIRWLFAYEMLQLTFQSVFCPFSSPPNPLPLKTDQNQNP